MHSHRARKNHPAQRPIANCRDEVTLIGDYLSGNLSDAEQQAFETHLSGCSDCGAFLTTYKKTIEMTRTFLRAGLHQQPRLELHRPL